MNLRSPALTLLGVVLVACSGSDTASSTSAKPSTTTGPTMTVPETTTPKTTVTETTAMPVASTTTPAPAAPETTVAGIPTNDGQPAGFDLRAATITADGTTFDMCLWVADTAERRAQGLMQVTDLGPAAGMAFVYDAPNSGNFWMKNTLMPLTITYYDASGAFMSATDMEPCTTAECELYPTADGFITAVEFEQGTAADFGAVDGSTLTLSTESC